MKKLPINKHTFRTLVIFFDFVLCSLFYKYFPAPEPLYQILASIIVINCFIVAGVAVIFLLSKSINIIDSYIGDVYDYINIKLNKSYVDVIQLEKELEIALSNEDYRKANDIKKKINRLNGSV